MELRQIRYFLALAEELNFTRASIRLGIAQPPLSQQIKALEQEVGTRLFRRTPRGAELTDAGRAFHARVTGIPQQAADSILAARQAANGEIGLVRVGFTGSAVFNDLVPHGIRSYRRRWPRVELSLTEANSDHLATALRNRTLDVAFLRPDAIDLTGLDTDLLDAEPMVAAVPASMSRHAMGHGHVTLASLAPEPFILTPRPLGPTLVDVVLGACRRVGFTPLLGQSAPQIPAVLALVAAEFGVSIVPRSMRRAAIDGVRYLDISDVAVIANLAIACRQDEDSRATRAFVSHVRNVEPTPP